MEIWLRNANFSAKVFWYSWEKLALEKGEFGEEKRAASGISHSAMLNFQADPHWLLRLFNWKFIALELEFPVRESSRTNGQKRIRLEIFPARAGISS